MYTLEKKPTLYRFNGFSYYTQMHPYKVDSHAYKHMHTHIQTHTCTHIFKRDTQIKKKSVLMFHRPD